jgi:peptidoglycan/xylan/chitin deacetylase (PgdA/CDA1 family)
MDLEERLGIRSTFNIVPERYSVSQELLREIRERGFGLGVHGLSHDGKLFLSYEGFIKKAHKINGYLRAWDTRGFSSPSMHHNLEWMHHLDIDYSISTFDTDPFEPQPDAACTIFPFMVKNTNESRGFVEMPYTLPQDFTLFVILGEKNIDIWKRKLDWIAQSGGMALINTHPDYMNFDEKGKSRTEEYPVRYYADFITHLKNAYEGRFWSALPEQIAAYILSKTNGNKS